MKYKRLLITMLVVTVLIVLSVSFFFSEDESPRPTVNSGDLHTEFVWKWQGFNSSAKTNVTGSPKIMPIKIDTTLIVGGLNAIGYSIATYLQEKKYQVIVTEDYIAPDFDITSQKQQFSDKLKEEKKKKPPSVFSYAKPDEVDKIFNENQDIKTMIYIPSVSAPEEVILKDGGIKNFAQLVKNFVNLLAIVRSKWTDTRIVLLANYPSGLVQKELQGLFTLVLNSYKTNSSLDIQVVQVGQGDTCSNFEDLIGFIYSTEPVSTSEQFFQCSEGSLGMFQDTDTSHETKNILFSTYFTDNKAFVRPYRENNFQFVKGFLITAMKYKLWIVIYYDQMNPKFKRRLLDLYDRIEFIHYKGNFYKRTINDARFYLMYDYLLEHPEVERIVLQDLRDGIYLEDPFKVMEVMGDYIYAGKDVSFHSQFTASIYRRCESVLRRKHPEKRLYPMMNAGTLGGTRYIMLAFLTQIIKYFEEVFPVNVNCNMDAFDFVTHYFFQDVLFSGYPFQGFMQIGLSSAPGIAIRHKRTRYDM